MPRGWRVPHFIARVDLKPHLHYSIHHVGLFRATKVVYGCVSVLSSGLLCPGVGSVSISYNNWSVTGCVPALGGGLPCPGVGRVGVSVNQLVTGCVPALGGGLLCPGVDRVGVSMNRSVTGCVPVPGSYLVPELAGSVVHMCTVSVWPRPGARVGIAVPDQVFRLGADSSRDHWYVLRHQLRSRIRPRRQAKIQLLVFQLLV